MKHDTAVPKFTVTKEILDVKKNLKQGFPTLPIPSHAENSQMKRNTTLKSIAAKDFGAKKMTSSQSMAVIRPVKVENNEVRNPETKTMRKSKSTTAVNNPKGRKQFDDLSKKLTVAAMSKVAQKNLLKKASPKKNSTRAVTKAALPNKATGKGFITFFAFLCILKIFFLKANLL